MSIILRKTMVLSVMLAMVFSFSLLVLGVNTAKAYEEGDLSNLPDCTQASRACTDLAHGTPEIEYTGPHDMCIAIMWCKHIPPMVGSGPGVVNYLGNLSNWTFENFNLRFLDQTDDAGVMADFGTNTNTTHTSCYYRSEDQLE
ncbi:MAG: hypothetical protein V4486_01180 [Patescibacteria group bacterium]